MHPIHPGVLILDSPCQKGRLRLQIRLPTFYVRVATTKTPTHTRALSVPINILHRTRYIFQANRCRHLLAPPLTPFPKTHEPSKGLPAEPAWKARYTIGLQIDFSPFRKTQFLFLPEKRDTVSSSASSTSPPPPPPPHYSYSLFPSSSFVGGRNRLF